MGQLTVSCIFRGGFKSITSALAHSFTHCRVDTYTLQQTVVYCSVYWLVIYNKQFSLVKEQSNLFTAYRPTTTADQLGENILRKLVFS